MNKQEPVVRTSMSDTARTRLGRLFIIDEIQEFLDPDYAQIEMRLAPYMAQLAMQRAAERALILRMATRRFR